MLLCAVSMQAQVIKTMSLLPGGKSAQCDHPYPVEADHVNPEQTDHLYPVQIDHPLSCF